MAIPQSFIQDLIARADVVEVVGRYVQLKKAGANFQGLCPFHSEKSPSFTVSPTKQFFHCFGCGKNGNVIGFLMEHSGMSFVEAVQQLAGQMGMKVPEEHNPNRNPALERQQKDRRQMLSSVLEQAAKAYQQQLKQSPEAIAYCKQRGLSGQIAKRFQLGFSPDNWRMLASVFPHYDDASLVDSGLVIVGEGQDGQERRYDRFRHRLMFPIRNVNGECIGFGGRVLGDEKPKYLNSPETEVFNKGKELYGLFEARQAIREKGYVLITEGYMDVVALAQLGFPNSVATLGTACTADHVHKIFRFTDKLVFSFDGDAAGRRAAGKALETSLAYATDGRSIQFLFLPAEHDPDSYIRAYGPERFEEQVQNATPLSQFLFDTLEHQCQLHTAEGRAQLLKLAKPLWQQLPQGGLKVQLTIELAQKAQVPLEQLEKLWADASQAGRPTATHPAQGERYGNSNSPRPAGPASAAEPSVWEDGIPYEENAGYSSQPKPPRSNRYDAGIDPRDGEQPASNWRSGNGFGKNLGGKGQWNNGRGNGFGRKELASNRPRRGRLDTRADFAVRLIFLHSELWLQLTHEDHNLLCHLPAPYGELFVWLDNQLHEHGPLAHMALLEQLTGHPGEDLLRRLTADNATKPQSAQDCYKDLRDVLNRMLLDHIKDYMNELAQTMAHDATAQQSYRECLQRSKELSQALLSSAV
ncbi:DNA primase [Curvibacter sp. CHRR-16]|uniref:DNA primase n=1 Tax=Curvibacter sp. CHRR-16 TaxID=2835872 RepID=UPI001BDAD72B|nr:DNA primase [Curvibacter sp. CHRR-16]MBT0568921.1 DNA primase [Curvibacter sp. CHRR-16]